MVKARISKQGDDKVVIIPKNYREDFPHRSMVVVKLKDETRTNEED